MQATRMDFISQFKEQRETHNVNIDSNRAQLKMRQDSFKKQFQETLVNFKQNMNLLESQSIKVKKMYEDLTYNTM